MRDALCYEMEREIYDGKVETEAVAYNLTRLLYAEERGKASVYTYVCERRIRTSF